MKNKDVEGLENIIRVLNKCYTLHMKQKHFLEAAKCAKDILICKRELKKLIKAKDDVAAENAHNGKGDTAKDAANK